MENNEPTGTQGIIDPEATIVENTVQQTPETAVEPPCENTGETAAEDQVTAVAESADLYLAPKTKAELTDLLATLLSERPIQSLRADVEAIKIAFYKLHRAELEAAHKAWEEARSAEDGSETATAFEVPVDTDELRLKELISEYRRRRDEHTANIDAQREDNLRVKLAIVEELKNLIEAGESETIGHTFNAFRDLQQRWRDTGPVPMAATKDLWETYNHHVENFYSFIRINKELRDMDLRKNYEAKIALCEAAEALMLEPDVIAAFHKLQKLHDEWRETGPVAAEHKEEVWERFREASGRINKQHQGHFDELKEEQNRNLALKTELCGQVEGLLAEPLTSRKDWNKASDKLMEIQKVWKTIGFAPKKDNTLIYQRFRAACDAFFATKREFFGEVKGELENNLELKTEICAAAEALAANDDWKATAEELIALQKRWKEIGPVPRRVSDAIWKRFRAACDAFFERKNAHFASSDAEYRENLERKRALLEEGSKRDLATLTFDDIKDFQRRWGEVGFVPIKQKESIAREYKDLVDRMFGAIRGSRKERSMESFRGRVSEMRTGSGGGGGKLKSERERLYNKVRTLEADIATLENNIGFFGNSKNAEAMIAGVREKIARSRAEAAEIVEKIKVIDAGE